MKETNGQPIAQRTAHLPDETIIDLYWDRNEKAIEETDQKYGKYLYTIAYNIVYNNEDCEECLNDTYLGTWNAIPPERPSVFQVFLSRIMRNIAVDRLRKNKADKRVPSEMMVSLEELDQCASGDPSLDEELAINTLGQLISNFLRNCSDREQFIFVCRYYYADKVENIANMLQIGASTVFRTLANIRGDLKEYLEKEGYGCER